MEAHRNKLNDGGRGRGERLKWENGWKNKAVIGKECSVEGEGESAATR